jgi:hypothetical protein
MNRTPTAISWLKSAGILLLCLLASMLLPFLVVSAKGAFPFSDFFFFLPQLSFPYDSVIVHDGNGSQRVFSDTAGTVLNIVQWGVVILGFALMTRRMSTRRTIVLAVVVVVAVSLAASYGARLFGASVELDGL